MTEQLMHQVDPRPLDELINAALGEMNEDKAWDAVVALHIRGTKEVLHRAASLCTSECVQERRLGANILGQLGVPNRSFPVECAAILFEMVDKEDDADVLQSIFIAFGHLGDAGVISIAPTYAVHPDPDVRHAVTYALMGHDDEDAIRLLIRLTTDVDSDVGDWATFALGTQSLRDAPEIRDALAARLDDEDDDTRGEAMVGLARRKDQRVVAAIESDLESAATEKAIEAAELLRSPLLLPSLIALRNALIRVPTCLEDAIASCVQH